MHTNSSKVDLVVAGLAYFEVFVPMHAAPKPGEEVFVEGIELGLGGALNTASVAAALGLNVTLCVPMGDGLVDHAVQSLAHNLGIALVSLPAPDNPAISLVFSSAQDRAFVSTAAMDTLGSLNQLPASSWVHVPGLEEAQRLQLPLQQARKQGARVSVSASWSPTLLAQLETYQGQAWDVLVLNEKEALAACGDAHRAPIRLSGAAQSVLVTLGADGVIGTLKGIPVRAPAVPVHVRDATGAGDAFCAGLIAGLVHKASAIDSVQVGIQAAALILQQTGGVATHAKAFTNLTRNNQCKS